MCYDNNNSLQASAHQCVCVGACERMCVCVGVPWRSLRSLLKSCFVRLAVDIRLIALITMPVFGIFQLNSKGMGMQTLLS